MASKQPSHTTQTTEVKLPEWVDKASESNYQLAQQIANKPLQQYQGPTVASPSQTTLDAYDFFKDTGDTGVTSILGAGDIYKKLGNFDAGSMDPTEITADAQKYLNPYISNVEDKALSALNDQRIQALMGNADKAVAAKAFGGSRSAIVDAVTNAETAKSAGLLSADLRKSGWDQALQSAMQGQLADINANVQSAGVQSGAAQGLLTQAEAAQKNRMGQFSGLLGIGQQEQQQSQQEINAAVDKFNEAKNYDLDRLNILLSSLGMSPYGKAETTDKVTSGGSSGTDFAMMGLGILQLLPALMGLSEDDEKTDKKKLGMDKTTGLPIYAYRYKGDPKTYPKVVGPMASDIEKKYPHLVGKVGGKRVVNFAGLLADG